MTIQQICDYGMSLANETYMPDVDAHDEKCARHARDHWITLMRACQAYRKALESIRRTTCSSEGTCSYAHSEVEMAAIADRALEETP